MTAISNSNVSAAALPLDTRNTVQSGQILKLLDIGVLVVALLIFILFLFLLVKVVFPKGSRLLDNASMSTSSVLQGNDRGAIDIATDGDGNSGAFIAQLGQVRRDVKIRSADSIAWTSASSGTAVRNRDAIQTFSDSRARVDFTTDNELRIGPNSLVVFSNGAADPFLARREPAVVVMDGELTGAVHAEYGALGIQLPAGLVELTADERSGEDVDFRVSVNPDQSSTIAVYSGRADVNIAGEHHMVAANKGLTIAKDGTTDGVTALPSLPVIRQPNDRMVARYLETPPRVTFAWDHIDAVSEYRLEIAGDAGFEQIVVDEYLEATSFVHGNLAPADYYWRVSARTGWVQGPVTKPRRLRVIRDSESPQLQLQRIERLTASDYVLRGSTTKNARVYVLGEAVNTTADGQFEFIFKPRTGTQSIVVESIDAVGNVSYSSQLLHVPGSSGRSD